MQAQGWYRDPFGIHGDRWFSEGLPTSLVRDQGDESYDEPPSLEPPLPLVPVDDILQIDGNDLLRADQPVRTKRNAVDGSGSLGIGFH